MNNTMEDRSMWCDWMKEKEKNQGASWDNCCIHYLVHTVCHFGLRKVHKSPNNSILVGSYSQRLDIIVKYI